MTSCNDLAFAPLCLPLLPAVPLPLQAVISMDSELVAVPVEDELSVIC